MHSVNSTKSKRSLTPIIGQFINTIWCTLLKVDLVNVKINIKILNFGRQSRTNIPVL